MRGWAVVDQASMGICSNSKTALGSVKSNQIVPNNRGPDSTGQHQILIESKGASVYATFLSTVLALRGSRVIEQPLKDEATGSVLCWNGEAWSIAGNAVQGNDSQLVFSKLQEACVDASASSVRNVVELLSSIRGPYAVVFYDAPNKRVYYGRDCLGRRSLLRKAATDGTIVLSSVCDNASGEAWNEVEADGIYVMDLNNVDTALPSFPHTHIPHRRLDQDEGPDLSFTLPFPAMNRSIPTQAPLDVSIVERLWASLEKSLQLRTQHVREAVPSSEARVAILFSGGLDCTILARMCNDLLPPNEPIDLLNVAFENPRIHSNLQSDMSPYELCPDRITGRSSHAELIQVCPGRDWRFVEVNVPYVETQAQRKTVLALMHPTTLRWIFLYRTLYILLHVGSVSHARRVTIRCNHTPPPHMCYCPGLVLMSYSGDISDMLWLLLDENILD
ncbi:hypothetical protein P3342_008023 [Pyrenophora teres f. teres]|nr:hypothetical protein P3342_008023 [Pyrenophora teres f. teres]